MLVISSFLIIVKIEHNLRTCVFLCISHVLPHCASLVALLLALLDTNITSLSVHSLYTKMLKYCSPANTFHYSPPSLYSWGWGWGVAARAGFFENRYSFIYVLFNHFEEVALPQSRLSVKSAEHGLSL